MRSSPHVDGPRFYALLQSLAIHLPLARHFEKLLGLVEPEGPVALELQDSPARVGGRSMVRRSIAQCADWEMP